MKQLGKKETWHENQYEWKQPDIWQLLRLEDYVKCCPGLSIALAEW